MTGSGAMRGAAVMGGLAMLALAGCGRAEAPTPVAPAGTPQPVAQDRYPLVESRHDAPATLARLFEALDRRELTVFAVVDHAAAAREAGTEMPFATVVIFGDPALGTPLMQARPALAAELPLRAAVFERGDGVFVAVTGAAALSRTFDLAEEAETLDRIGGALESVAAEAADR